MNIKTLLTSLRDHLKTSTGLTYLNSRVYIAENIIGLIKRDIPFVNIEPNAFTAEPADNMRTFDMERYVYTVTLQFATIATSRDLAVLGDANTKGILDLHDDLYAAIKTDQTLGGQVDGLLMTPSIIVEVFPPAPEEMLYLAGAEMKLTYYKDHWNR